MAIQFRGDVEGIGAGQLDFIRTVLQDNGFKNEEAEITAVGKDGDNYVAQVRRITVNKDGETFKMVAKIAPLHEAMRALGNTVVMFTNESIMYSKVLPKFNELQKMAGVPENERFKFPHCYGCCVEDMNEVILLEDLQITDYTMLDRFTPLTDQCVRTVLKNFAIFHSLSYALKYQEPQTYTQVKKDLIDMWALSTDIPEAKESFKKMEEDSMSLLEGDKYKKVMKGAIADMATNFAKLSKADAGSRHSVIQHGDAWTNNIMFKLNGDQVTDVMLIDYQVSKETSPVCDLHYMIFNCTDYETRRKHFHDWIDHYHSELDKSLHNYGLKANYVYPKDQLDVDLKRYGRAMFGMSVIVNSVLIRNSEDAGKVKEAWANSTDIEQISESLRVSGLDETSRTLYRTRIEGLIDSLFDLGLL